MVCGKKCFKITVYSLLADSKLKRTGDEVLVMELVLGHVSNLTLCEE